MHLARESGPATDMGTVALRQARSRVLFGILPGNHRAQAGGNRLASHPRDFRVLHRIRSRLRRLAGPGQAVPVQQPDVGGT